jgi:hypothetical protein
MKMQWTKRVSLLLACLMLGSAGVAQIESGDWRPASTSAKQVTGDLIFGGDRVAINFSTFLLAQIRELKPEEATLLFNADPNSVGRGNLYRVSIPAGKTFLHKNSLCGSEETDWLITYMVGKHLQVAFFSDPKIPTLTPDGLNNNSTLCGTYEYQR